MKTILSHRHGGAPWVMCQDLDKDYCRVTWASPQMAGTGFATQVFLAWKKLLSVHQRAENPKDPASPIVDALIDPKIMKPLKLLRKQLEDGTYTVKDTRIIKAS